MDHGNGQAMNFVMRHTFSHGPVWFAFNLRPPSQVILNLFYPVFDIPGIPGKRLSIEVIEHNELGEDPQPGDNAVGGPFHGEIRFNGWNRLSVSRLMKYNLV